MSVFSLDAAAEEGGTNLALLGQDLSFDFLTLREAARTLSPLVRELATRGRPVGLWGTPEPAHLAFLFAALEAGLPLLLLHPRSGDAHQAQSLERAGACALFRRGELRELPVPPDAPALPPDTAVLLETSGSTALPKTVLHTRSSLAAAARASAEHLGWSDGGDRWILSLPIAHVGGLSILLRCFLSRKTTVVAALPTEQPLLAQRLLDELAITLVSLVPTQLARLLAEPSFRFPPRVRVVLVGGAPLSDELRSVARERGVPLSCTYGMTEFGSQVTTERPADRGTGVGEPLPGFEVRLDEEGRIGVRGPAAFVGYLGLPPPFDENGFFWTNDRGRWDEAGHLHVLGRLDSILISGGENVHPEGVEASLLALPEVEACCVVGVPDPVWGERVVAVIVPRTGAQLELEATRAALRGELPSYALPRELLFLPELPLLPSGKLDRRAAAAWARERVARAEP